ncbi:MAG: hypothetical protein AB1489_10680 [Acidobacteriota bacterium]
MALKLLTLSFTLILLSFSAVAGQLPDRPTTTPTDKQQQAEKELQKRALELIDEIVASTQSLKLPENRIRIQLSLVNLLWSRDENRARTIFIEAERNLAELLRNFSDEPHEQYYAAYAPLQLRTEMMQAMATRDAKLTLDFLRSTRLLLPPNPYSNPNEKEQLEGELQLELSLAAQVAAENPTQAIKIAEEALAKGLNSSVIGVISQLQEKEPEAAARLASQLVSKIRSENLATNDEARSVALSLLYLSPDFNSLLSPNVQDQPAGKRTQIIDERTLRELAEMLAAAALNIASNGNLLEPTELYSARAVLQQLQPLLPAIEKYAPARAVALRARIAKWKLDKPNPYNEFQSLLEKGTADDLMKAASKAPQGLRENFYAQAAWKAFNDGNIDQARQIAEKMPNVYQRNELLSQLDRQQLMRSADEGKLEEARRLLSQVRSFEERITILTQLVSTMMGKGNKSAARQLLSEARALMSGAPENAIQLAAQMQIAYAYANLEPATSFGLIEPIIDKLNELIAAAAVLDGFDNPYARRFKNGEMIMAGDLLYHGQGLLPLVRADFERALATANRFEREELKLLARLIVVEGLLTPPNSEAIPDTPPEQPSPVENKRLDSEFQQLDKELNKIKDK